MLNINDVIKQPEYDFLWNDDKLGNNLLFLTFGGSHAYGTNVEGSDIDIRGVTMNPPSSLIGLSNFEQRIDNATDTTIYAFKKFVSLALQCNPNIIEMLGGKPENYVFRHTIGYDLVRQRDLFLSQRVIPAFGGYAGAQLNRLQNALARDKLAQAEKMEHIARSLRGAIDSFEQRYTAFDNGGIVISTGPSDREDVESEVFADINLKHYPAHQFNSILNELSSIVRDYEKLNARNKKDDKHLNKHAMHLVRLYLMAFDLLEKGEIVTYRENERELLLSIRNGAYQNDDGTFKSEFFELVDELEKRFVYDKTNNVLPEKPDMRKVEDFVMTVNEHAIRYSREIREPGAER